VTRYEGIGDQLDESFKIDSFSEMVRFPEPGQPGHWTGWFMGDGDEVGTHLKNLTTEAELRKFSEAMRNWGKDFKDQFPKNLGRVVYAGGDDFMGVIYSENPKKPISESTALDWLTKLNLQWSTHQQQINLSVGFVWAGHSVPQRDVLQHCREAEKRSKSLGRYRVTIRVVFNSGQLVQWTCPWDHLDILQRYRDRDGINTQEEIKKSSHERANWTHIYDDWEHLKACHAIPLKDKAENIDERVALELFELYFGDRAPRTDGLRAVCRDYFSAGDNCKHITGKAYSATAIIEWIDGLVKVGWQLCSNS
jgi:CRISPR-associated protein Cmr2